MHNITEEIINQMFLYRRKFCKCCAENDFVQLSNFFFLFILGVYFVYSLLNTTLFTIYWPDKFENILRVVAICSVILKTSCLKPDINKWLLCIGICSIFLLSSVMTGYMFLFDMAVLITGAVDIPYKKILKIYFWCGIIVMSLSITGALTGCIRDLVYLKNGFYRHSFGIVYPTDFSAHLVYLALTFWVIYEKVPTFYILILLSFLTVFQFCFCGTKCSEIITLLLIAGVFYERFAVSFRLNSFMIKLVYYIDKLLAIFIVICAFISIGISVWYNDNNYYIETLNTLLTNRLSLANKAIKLYGIKFFGTPFDMIGNGGETVFRPFYNFVDNSYCMISIRYGISVLIVLCFLYIFMQKKAKNTGNRKFLVAFALIAIHSMIEHHLLEIAYNPFFLLAFSDISSENLTEEKKIRYSNFVCYTIISLLLILSFSKVISYLKTLVTLEELNNPEKNIIFILLLFLLELTLLVLLKEVIRMFASRLIKKVFIIRFSAIVTCCFIFFSFIVISENIIQRGTFLY